MKTIPDGLPVIVPVELYERASIRLKTNQSDKSHACPDLTVIRTMRVEALVWDDCCRVFECLDLIRDTIESNIQASLQNMLENTQGKLLVADLKADIAYAKQERAKHHEGSYYYNLISQDVHEKEDRLRKYEAEYSESRDIVKLSEVYQRGSSC